MPVFILLIPEQFQDTIPNENPLKNHHFFPQKHGFPCQNMVFLVRTSLSNSQAADMLTAGSILVPVPLGRGGLVDSSAQ